MIFHNENVNILHTLISKLTEVVFSQERAIYDQYQEHLFCEVDIISLTILPIQKDTMKTAITKNHFGHLIKIIKNYSKIQTNNTKIYSVIQKYKDLWTNVANGIIKQYTEASQKELGTYDIQDPKPVEYKETKISAIVTHPAMIMNLKNIDDEGKTFRTMSYPHSGRLSFENNLFQLPIDLHPPE